MSVTRGTFLKALGKSLPGMALGTGMAAAQTVLGKIAAVSATREESAPAPAPITEPEKPAFITCGPAEGNQIALTFDDGPTPGVTDRILDEFKARGLHATFFMIGENIAVSPELARRVLAEGHDIGNHSYTHPHLTKLPESQVLAELQTTQDIIAKEMSHRTGWFRPPFGDLRANQSGVAEQAGLRVILWNIDPADWNQPGEEKISETILSKAAAGSIVVCHDSHAQTANCIGAILDGLVERGLTPVTLSKLLAHVN
jgi:peptidoglycan-N-acetylglucosamine deacetylase